MSAKPLPMWVDIALQASLPCAELIPHLPLPWVFAQNGDIGSDMWSASVCSIGTLRGKGAVLEWLTTLKHALMHLPVGVSSAKLALVHPNGILLRVCTPTPGPATDFYVALYARQKRHHQLMLDPSRAATVTTIQVDLFGPALIVAAAQHLSTQPWPKEVRSPKQRSATPHRGKLFVLEQPPFRTDLILKPYRLRPAPDRTLSLGPEFEAWSKAFQGKLGHSTSGIAIFHGPPGGGKTTYIEELIRTGVNTRRIVFMPSYIVEALTAPSLIAKLRALMGQPTILVIEDAEAIAKVGPGNLRSVATSVLLNLSDGLLGHVVQVTALLTVNCDPAELDPAISRSGRLITSRCFGMLTPEQINEIGRQLRWSDLRLRQALQRGPMTIADLLAAPPIPSDLETGPCTPVLPFQRQ